MDEEARAVEPKRGFHKMKQKKTARFSDSDSSASALKVPESKQSSQIVTPVTANTLGSQQKEGHMNTDTNTTTNTTATATRKTAKPAKGTPKALTLATCTACRAEYKAEKWHTESLCPECYSKAHPKTEKAETTAGQTIARAVAGVALAVLITKGTHYAVSVVNPTTGQNLSKVYLLKSHGEALTLAEQMYHDRKLADILDASPEATDTEAKLAGE
jgi:predicted Zn-ribbon and HTH transcriptional regulator